MTTPPEKKRESRIGREGSSAKRERRSTTATGYTNGRRTGPRLDQPGRHRWCVRRDRRTADRVVGVSRGAPQRPPPWTRTTTPRLRVIMRTPGAGPRRRARCRTRECHGEEGGADRGATRREMEIAIHERVIHQPAQTRPRHHEFHDERAAEHRPDDDAVDGEHGFEREPQGVTPDHPSGARPRARAASMAGCASASASACDCSRSSDGHDRQRERESGSTRYRLASITLPRPARRLEAIPCGRRTGVTPATARGTAWRARGETAPWRRDTSVCRLPVRTPSGRPTSVARRSAVKPRSASVPRARLPGRRPADGSMHDSPRSSGKMSRAQIVYCGRRSSRGQPGALGGNRRRTGLKRRQPATRREVREEHRGGRDHQDEHEGRHDPPNQKRQDPRN